MTTSAVNIDSTVDPIWKDRIERALKYISRAIDQRQRRDAVSIFTNLAEQIRQNQRPRLISEPIVSNDNPTLYTSCSYEEITGDKLISSVSILPQTDQLPNMFTYVPLQRNFLCDTVTNLSDLVLDEEDEDIKIILNSNQSDSSQPIRVTSSSSKRTRRTSKTVHTHDRNTEFHLDEEHLIELLKRLKEQAFENESNLFENLIKLHPSSADLIRDRFSTIFESKGPQSKEFIPNIDKSSLALDTTVDNTLHSYFMLFCRRCHRYDCFLHKDKQAIPDLTIERKNFSSIYRPCSRHCYRINPKETKIEFRRSQSELADHRTCKISSNGYHSKRPKFATIKSEPLTPTNFIFPSNGFSIKPSLKRKLTDELSEWSASEKSLFRVFHTIYADNICLIANLLDKPCSQVYVFYTNEMASNEKKKTCLQRQSSTTSTSTVGSFSGITSTTSSDSSGTKINGIAPKVLLTNGVDQSDFESSQSKERETNPQRRSHSSSFRRQQILFNHQNTSSSDKKRHTYYPCDHDRSTPCNEHCYCVRSGNFCEKFCCCSASKCDNRFPGCRCRSSCTTKQCSCYAAGRECDPDLCTSCGADDFRNINHEIQTCTISSCHNVAIQRSLHKPLLLAESDVAGWGMFTQVNIQRNEFIAEYCGEIVTQDEGELRGRMYDASGTSFLFDLNEEYMVDATRRGNKIRFANHSINPNCYAKIILVNGDHRIGIYSKRSIVAGEELFFDYRYGANHHLRFVGVEKNTSRDLVDT